MAQNTGRLAKKFLAVGKIYNTALMTDQEIEDAVQKDLDDFVGKDKVNFSITTTGKMISLIFIRFTEYYKQNNADLKKGYVGCRCFHGNR